MRTVEGVIFWLFVGVTLTGCTAWRHDPPVALDQHRLDLRECLGVARGWTPIPAPGVGVSPVNTAIAGLDVAATVVGEIEFEARLSRCMGARGYRRAGLTTNIYGWRNE